MRWKNWLLVATEITVSTDWFFSWLTQIHDICSKSQMKSISQTIFQLHQLFFQWRAKSSSWIELSFWRFLLLRAVANWSLQNSDYLEKISLDHMIFRRKWKTLRIDSKLLCIVLLPLLFKDWNIYFDTETSFSSILVEFQFTRNVLKQMEEISLSVFLTKMRNNWCHCLDDQEKSRPSWNWPIMGRPRNPNRMTSNQSTLFLLMLTCQFCSYFCSYPSRTRVVNDRQLLQKGTTTLCGPAYRTVPTHL